MEKKVSNTLLEGDAPEQTVKHQRIRLQFDIEYNGTTGKIMDPNGKTVPDMNLTVRQLLENHTRGKNGEESIKQPLYFDTPIPTIRDMVDVDNYREYLANQTKLVNQFIEDEKQAKKAADDKSAAEKAAKAAANKSVPTGTNSEDVPTE